MKTIYMLKEDHEKWDAALRSGEYKQGKYSLKTPENTYCCLGVLQMALSGYTEEEKQAPSLDWLRAHKIQFRGGGSCQSVPYLPSLLCDAVTANDHADETFVKIADAIKDCVEYV